MSEPTRSEKKGMAVFLGIVTASAIGTAVLSNNDSGSHNTASPTPTVVEYVQPTATDNPNIKFGPWIGDFDVVGPTTVRFDMDCPNDLRYSWSYISVDSDMTNYQGNIHLSLSIPSGSHSIEFGNRCYATVHIGG